MQVIQEVVLARFEFWGGAKYTAKWLTYGDFFKLEDELNMLYPDGIDGTALNDMFWFERDYIAELLGFENWEALEADHDFPEEE